MSQLIALAVSSPVRSRAGARLSAAVRRSSTVALALLADRALAG